MQRAKRLTQQIRVVKTPVCSNMGAMITFRQNNLLIQGHSLFAFPPIKDEGVRQETSPQK